MSERCHKCLGQEVTKLQSQNPMWRGRYSFHFERRYLSRMAFNYEIWKCLGFFVAFWYRRKSASNTLFPVAQNHEKIAFFLQMHSPPAAKQKIGSAVSTACNVSSAETCILLKVASCAHVLLHWRLNLELLQLTLWPSGFRSVAPSRLTLSFRCSDFTYLLRRQDHNVWCRLCPKT